MSNKSYIIAEAGVNHNGDMELARELVDIAVEAKASAVKFQTFQAEKVVTRDAAKAAYQEVQTGGGESQFDMLKKLELPREEHFKLKDYCDTQNIDFLSTAFDEESLDFLVQDVGIERIKIPSGEITNGPLIYHAARYGLPIILSTGMSTIYDIGQALTILAQGYLGSEPDPKAAIYKEGKVSQLLNEKVVLLQCTSEYPAPPEDLNLNAMLAMHETFGLPVGFSDHSETIYAPIAAAAIGACVIEKHFTKDKNLAGPDHQASLDPRELNAMVEGVRFVEKALGRKEKKPSASEIKNQPIIRRSIIAKNTIEEGGEFNAENLTCKRPATGISPMEYWGLLGKTASKKYEKEEQIG